MPKYTSIQDVDKMIEERVNRKKVDKVLQLRQQIQTRMRGNGNQRLQPR